MRLKYSFETTELDDYVVAVPVGANAGGYSGVIKLNKTAAFIFSLLEKDTTEEAIVNEVEKAFSAPRDIIVSEVRNYIKAFTERGMLVQ